MLKFREGKLMLINMVILVVMALSSIYFSQNYSSKLPHTVITISIFAITIICSILQIVCTVKLHKARNEENK